MSLEMLVLMGALKAFSYFYVINKLGPVVMLMIVGWWWGEGAAQPGQASFIRSLLRRKEDFFP